MSDLNLKPYDPLYPMRIHPYEELLKDQNASVIDKINSIIDYLNSVGKLTNDVVKNWNTVYNWVMNEGLATGINNKLEDMLAKGEFDTILNTVVTKIGDITTLTTTDKSSLTKAVNEIVSKIGDLTTLTTPQKDTIVHSINSLQSEVATNTNAIATNTSQLSDIVINVKTFGAKGDGVSDDSVSIQNALNYLRDHNGGTLLIPDGKYIVTALDVYSNTTIEFQSWNAILKHKYGFTGRYDNPNYPPSTYPKKYDGIFTVNALAWQTNQETQKNITIKNGCLEGNSVESGFFETLCLITLSDSENVSIEKMKFVAPQGDGIWVLADILESHNKNITICNCHFDGVNYENRQAISITEGENVIIENNYITHFTKSTMPSAIDLESLGLSWAIMRNITVRNNTFNQIGADFKIPAIMIVIDNPTEHVETQEFFSIYGNYFQQCACISIRGRVNVNDSTPTSNILIKNNQGLNTGFPIRLGDVRGVTIEDNLFNKATDGMLLGSGTAQTSENAWDIIFRRNKLIQMPCSNVYTGKNYQIEENTFIDCGGGAYPNALFFSSGYESSTYFKVNNNRFVSNSGVMTLAINVAGSFVTDFMNNSFRGNKVIGTGLLGYIPSIKAMGEIYVMGAEKILFTTASLPTAFPVGETIFYSNDSALPSTAKAGIVRTVITGNTSGSSSEKFSTIQFFTPYGGEPGAIYWRYAESDLSTWKPWYKVTGTLA